MARRDDSSGYGHPLSALLTWISQTSASLLVIRPQVLETYRSMDDFAKIRMLGYETVPGPGE